MKNALRTNVSSGIINVELSASLLNYLLDHPCISLHCHHVRRYSLFRERVIYLTNSAVSREAAYPTTKPSLPPTGGVVSPIVVCRGQSRPRLPLISLTHCTRPHCTALSIGFAFTSGFIPLITKVSLVK